ncbi:hypothetical protein ACOSP7_018931 [Xanthoceras sorbifolium]
MGSPQPFHSAPSPYFYWKVVCVTGPSSYIASWLVKQLLQHGYTVKATVPNLLEEGSFDSAVDGCDGVFHTACSEYFSANDPKADIVDTAVKGTLNVLKSCAKASSVKRVIYTSSTAAVMCNKKPLTPDTVVDETWFLDPVVCEETKNWYALSKTLAEDATWNSQKRMELTWVEDDKPIEQTYQVSRAKAESLGISNFISWEVSLQDTIESLKKKGFLSF